MSDTSQGPEWWLASDGKWYPPTSHPNYVAPPVDEAAAADLAPPPPPPPPPQPQPYPYQQHQTYVPPPRTNGTAIASLVLGLIGLGFIGIFLGYSARREIDRSNGTQTGSGLATAGIILGYLQIIAIVGLFAIAALGNSAATKFSTVANSIN